MRKFFRSPEKKEIIVHKETERGKDLIIENQVMRSGDYSYTKDIIWRSAKGKEVNFNDFLPNKKWHFVKEPLEEKEGLRYSYSVLKTGEGHVGYGDLGKHNALISLFHEIGHAHIWEKTGEREQKKAQLALVAYKWDIEKRLLTKEDIKKRGENPEDYVYLKVYDPMGKTGSGYVGPDDQYFQMLVPRKLVEKGAQEFARVERDAWAYALRILRRLKKKGLILEPDLELEDFKNKIYSMLESYEKWFTKELKIKGKHFTKDKKFKRVKLS